MSKNFRVEQRGQACYIGYFEKGALSGPGIRFQENGEVCYGKFMQGELRDFGTVKYSSGDEYNGFLSNGKALGPG